MMVAGVVVMFCVTEVCKYMASYVISFIHENQIHVTVAMIEK